MQPNKFKTLVQDPVNAADLDSAECFAFLGVRPGKGRRRSSGGFLQAPELLRQTLTLCPRFCELVVFAWHCPSSDI